MPLDRNTLRKLNSRLIFSQFLKKSANGKSSLVDVSDALCGVNSQNFRDSYMSYWTRSTGFSENKLVSSIKPRGELSRTWTVRGTVHTFPTTDYKVHVFGSPVEKFLKSNDRYAKQLGVPDRETRIRKLYEPLLDEIGGSKVTTDFVHNFISDRLDSMGLKGRQKLERGWSSEKIMGPTWRGIHELSYLGLLSNAGRRGSGNLWMSTKHWLGYEPSDWNFYGNAKELVKKYIEKYGPVTIQDIAYWTGHKMSTLVEILADLKPEINNEQINDSLDKYYLTEEMESDYPPPPHIIVLPRFDSLIMGYRNKSRILDHDFLDRVSIQAGIIMPTILVDGFVKGVWSKSTKGKTLNISVEPFKKFTDRNMKTLERKFSKFAIHEGLNLNLKFSTA